MKQMLQYLWIEKYGCIEKQGFNFTNRVHIKFDYEKKELSIVKNKNYCDNFFGKNIEVSCIVGQNGVGKTTLLRALKEICSLIDTINIYEYSFIAIFFDGYKYKGYYTLNELNYDTSKLTLYPIKYKKQSNTQSFEGYEHTDYLYYSEQLVHSQYKISFDDHELSLSHLLYRAKSVNEFFIKEFEKQMNLMIDYGKQLEKFKIRYSSYVTASLPNYDMIWQDFIGGIKRGTNEEAKEENILEYRNIYDAFLSQSGFREEVDYFKDKLAETMFLNIIKNFMNSDIKWDDKLLDVLVSEMRNCSKGYAWDNFKMFLGKKNRLNKKRIYYVGNYIQFVNYIDNKCEFSEWKDAFVQFKINGIFLIPIGLDCNVKTDLKSSIQEFYKFYQEAAVFHSFINFSWELSSGETALLNIFSRLYSSDCRKNKKKVAVFLLDEIDVTLHPEWQRTIINELLKFIKYAFKNKQVQIIMTTHSPIMLSDIPKQNVLFLNQDNGMKVDDGCDTFASNIFQLFRDGFFIGDTGIGVYAEEKLKEIVEHIHNHDIKDSEIEKLILAVGDILIRNKLNEEYLMCRLQKKSTKEKQADRIALLEQQLEDIDRNHYNQLIELQEVLKSYDQSSNTSEETSKEYPAKTSGDPQNIIDEINTKLIEFLTGGMNHDTNKK